MLNNPDEQPAAVLNRWIAYIQLFDFELRHVSKGKHKGPDGLSRRKPTEEEVEEARTEKDIEDQLEEKMDIFYFSHISPLHNRINLVLTTLADIEATPETGEEDEFLPSRGTPAEDSDLEVVKYYLTHLKFPETVEKAKKVALLKRVSDYFVLKGKLWRRDRKQGKHQQVIPPSRRFHLLHQAHDNLGHKQFYSTRETLRQRFWWPHMGEDIRWYLRTCHECQQRNMLQIRLPPTVPQPPTLFRRCHIDTFFIPKHHGFRYVIHAPVAGRSLFYHNVFNMHL
jgi:hypothetical protein